MREINRRKLLALAPALTAGFAIGPSINYGPILNSSMQAMLESFFDNLIPENRMAQRVAKYARIHPAIPAKMNLIEAEIARTLQVDYDQTRTVIGRQISKKIRNDFNRGQTISVDGWLLAETEIAVIALAARHRKS